jgi:hypothetical protein
VIFSHPVTRHQLMLQFLYRSRQDACLTIARIPLVIGVFQRSGRWVGIRWGVGWYLTGMLAEDEATCKNSLLRTDTDFGVCGYTCRLKRTPLCPYPCRSLLELQLFRMCVDTMCFLPPHSLSYTHTSWKTIHMGKKTTLKVCHLPAFLAAA